MHSLQKKSASTLSPQQEKVCRAHMVYMAAGTLTEEQHGKLLGEFERLGPNRPGLPKDPGPKEGGAKGGSIGTRIGRENQQRVFEALSVTQPATVHDIAGVVGLYRGTVAMHIEKLIASGKVTRSPMGYRKAA